MPDVPDILLSPTQLAGLVAGVVLVMQAAIPAIRWMGARLLGEREAKERALDKQIREVGADVKELGADMRKGIEGLVKELSQHHTRTALIERDIHAIRTEQERARGEAERLSERVRDLERAGPMRRWSDDDGGQQ